MSALAQALAGKESFRRPRIVVGGPDENGHRVASDVAASWSTDPQGVIWLDGWSKHSPGVFEAGERLVVLHYGEQNRSRFLAKLAAHDPGSASLFKRGLRKLDTATKGYLSWKLIAPEVTSIASTAEPELIVYCDDHSLTTAWHLSNTWPRATVRRA